MERKELKPRFINGFWWIDKDKADARIKELNKQLENAENAYYSLKMDMENRIKELEEELKERKQICKDLASQPCGYLTGDK